MSAAHAKVPAVPPSPLSLDPARHLRSFDGPLWRLFGTIGAHPQLWDQLRHFGPLNTMRFDPHPAPKQHHPDVGVMYTASRSTTALAEVFQRTRVINRSARGMTLASWRPTRTLTLLDLTSNWPVVNSASAAIMMAAKRNTRAWAHAIHAQFRSTVDGLYHFSSIDSQPMVTLFTRAEDSFPAFPAFLGRLDAPNCNLIVAEAHLRLGYDVSS